MLEFLQGLLAIRDVDQLGFLLAFLGAELLLTLIMGRPYYNARDSLCSVTMGLAYAASIALSAGIMLAMLFWVQQFAFVQMDWTSSAGLILAAYVIVDFLFYAYHRVIHEVRLGWAAHVNHHSSQHFNGGTALRSSFVEAWIEPFFLIPAVLIGIHPVMAVALVSLNHLYQYWIHTRFIGKLGPFEWVFNTPSHHRVHHASNVQYCDRNYAGTLIIWDRLFGTFEREEEEPVFGIRHQLNTWNPIKATFHEWIAIGRDLLRARSLREVGGYLFQPPGWSPEGDGETTRVMQARYREEQAMAAPRQAAAD
ncbi:sterol desaturase family protein [Parvibaculum sp. MBR-TMA-1.3b-4.2]|jgi:sterol desaturase/sphingolipid hydroxylase (fatty acid hydroxylase superfamily)